MTSESPVYIRSGETRNEFAIVYHDVFDLYHPYIGDKATLYYLYLLRYRNNQSDSVNQGKAWPGRIGIVEKFQMSFSTLPQIDKILEAVGLVTVQTKPSGRGKEKIYYIVHDPKDRQRFRYYEGDFEENLARLVEDGEIAPTLLGKQKGVKITRK